MTQYINNRRKLAFQVMTTNCNTCQAHKKQLQTAQAKIQSLSQEIIHRDAISSKLQEAKTRIEILTLQNEGFQQQVERQLTLITEQENTVHSLQCLIKQLEIENQNLIKDRKTHASIEQLHKQTRTALPGEDCAADGSILYTSATVINAIREKQEKQFTQKYVDPTGEAQLLPIIKLKNNMYYAIRRRLSKRHHIP